MAPVKDKDNQLPGRETSNQWPSSVFFCKTVIAGSSTYQIQEHGSYQKQKNLSDFQGSTEGGYLERFSEKIPYDPAQVYEVVPL